jgi:hypothetical protein
MQSLNLSKDILQSTSLVISIIRLCVTAIIFIAGTIILIVISIKVISRINASLKKENNFIEQREIWLKRYEIWCQLFYCGRDRKLFDPIKGDYCDPEDMTNYISEIYNNKYMSQNA